MLCEAEKIIERFEPFVREHGSSKKSSIEKLCDTVRKVLQLLPDDVDHRNRRSSTEEAIGQCIAQHVAHELSMEYPLLSPDLFTKRRWVRIDFTEGAEAAESVLREPEPAKPKDKFRWVRVPLLIESSSRGVCTLGSVPWPGSPRVSATLYAKFPGSIGRQHLRHADRAWAKLHRIYADLLENDLIAQFVRTDVPRPRVSAFWIPSLPSIYVREVHQPDRRDPALVLTINKYRFLCCMWEADSEEPLEALMREFSEGGTINQEDDEENFYE